MNRKVFLLVISAVLLCCIAFINQKKDTIKVGVYYFDGWTGKTFHITQKMKDEFPERKPKWGWITSTPEAVEAQIELAADAGIDFFNFCWYYNGKSGQRIDNDPKNNALNLYLKAANKPKLDFSILVCNHAGYIIKPEHWELLCDYWCEKFKDSSYIKANGKPLLTFFSVPTLINSFGNVEGVRKALARLRFKADSLQTGVTVAACVNYKKTENMKIALECGFDVLTNYNNHDAGFGGNAKEFPIEKLIEKEKIVWKEYTKFGLPYIPASTLNWDQRPWADVKKEIADAPRYTGFSAKSVFRSVQSLKKWTLQNPTFTTKERIAMIYAWNEYGEGAWLTPSQDKKSNLLEGVKRALK